MKRLKLWAILGMGVLLLGAGAIGFCHTAAGRAYLDIATGRPKYFVVTGPPSTSPVELPRAARELERRGVQVVFTGCIAGLDQDEYNVVIERHFNVTSPGLKPSAEAPTK